MPDRAPDELVPEEAFAEGIGRRVVRNYMISAVRLVVGQLLGLVVFVVLARRLDPSDYALYAGFAAAALAGYHLFADPLTTVLSRGDTMARRTVDATMTLLLATMAVLATAFVGVGVAYGWTPLLLAGGTVYLLGLAASFPSFAMLWRHVRTGEQGLLDLAERAAFQLAVLVLVLAGWSIERSIGVALAAAAVAFVVVARWFYPWRLRLASPVHARSVARQALHPFVALFTLLLVEMLTIPAVGLIADGHQAGLYAWAYSLVTVPVGFVATAIIGLQPAFARMQSTAVEESLERALRVIGALSVLATVTVAVAIPLSVELFLPDVWVDALPALWWLLGGAVVHGCTNGLVSLMNARGSLGQAARLQVGAYGAGFVAICMLASMYGATGAAAGYACSRIFLAVPLARFAAREQHVPLASITVRFLSCAGVSAVAGLAAGRSLGDGWLAVGAGTVAALMVAGVLAAALFRRHVRDDARSVWSMLRPSRTA